MEQKDVIVRKNIHCTNGRKCILLTDEITWDHDSRKAEHKLQEQYNGGQPCIVHSCATLNIALERRAETLDIFKRLLAHDAPEEMIKYRQLRHKWKEVDVYRRIKTLCPIPLTLRNNIFGKRSQLKLNEIMPEYLSGHKSVCLNCVPVESFSPLLDAIISKKLMHHLPPEAKPLMSLGSHLTPKYMRKMGVSGKILQQPNIIGLPISVSKGLSQYDPNGSVVKMSRQLSEIHHLEALRWKKKRAMCNLAKTANAAEASVKASNADNEIGGARPKPPTRAPRPKENIMTTYTDKATKTSTEISNRIEHCGINEYIGDVWNQLQPEQILIKEKKEKLFSKNVYPPSLNPIHSNVFPIEEVNRMREPTRLLNYIAKYPRRRLALKTYLQGLESADSKSHLVVRETAIVTPFTRRRMGIYKKREPKEPSITKVSEQPMLSKIKLPNANSVLEVLVAKPSRLSSVTTKGSISSVIWKSNSVGDANTSLFSPNPTIHFTPGEKNSALSLSKEIQRLTISKEKDHAESNNNFFRASARHCWELHTPKM